MCVCVCVCVCMCVCVCVWNNNQTQYLTNLKSKFNFTKEAALNLQ